MKKNLTDFGSFDFEKGREKYGVQGSSKGGLKEWKEWEWGAELAVSLSCRRDLGARTPEKCKLS